MYALSMLQGDAGIPEARFVEGLLEPDATLRYFTCTAVAGQGITGCAELVASLLDDNQRSQWFFTNVGPLVCDAASR